MERQLQLYNLYFSCYMPHFCFSERHWGKNQNMALDDSQILVQSFTAAKELIKRGSLSADDKVILGSYPQETYHHKDSPVLKQTSWFLDCTNLLSHFVHVDTQGGKDESKEGEFNLLFYAIKTRNYDAFTEILPRSDVSWQNSIGVRSYFYNYR